MDLSQAHGETSTAFPTRRPRWLRRDLRVLLVFLVVYAGMAYLLLPAWWRHHQRRSVLQEGPLITRTGEGIPGDPINVALYGSEEKLVHGLLAAGWHPADPTTWRTSLRISRSVLLGRPYPEAPVSNLFLWERRQDLAFERAAAKSPRQRHHVRFWRSEEVDEEDRPLWVGAATFDLSVGLSHRTGQVTHHIAPDVDAERDRLLDDLQQAGRLARRYQVLGAERAGWSRNGGGDRYFTSGALAVGVLARVNGPAVGD